MNINGIGTAGYLAMYGVRGTEGSVAESLAVKLMKTEETFYRN